MVWRFFNDTSKVGGTANLADQVFYIDSYKGDDANVGSNVAPFKTIQKALDSATQGNGADFILAGRFKEGDFLNRRRDIAIIAEGDVYIEPGLATVFEPTLGNTTKTGCFNIDIHNGNQIRNYGKLHFKDYVHVVAGTYFSNTPSFDLFGAHNCELKNISGNVLGNGATGSKLVQYCVFDNSTLYHQSLSGAFPERQTFIQNNNFINGGGVFGSFSIRGGRFRDNYGDSLAEIDPTSGTAPGSLNWTFEYNHFERNATNAFWDAYDTMDLWEAAQSGVENNIPQAQSPQFKGLNAEDYTYDSASPNATGGWAGGPVGAFGIGYSSKNVDAGGSEWTLVNITITGVGAASVANITTPGSIGTLTELVGVQIGFGEDVYIGPVTLPGFIQDFPNGEVIDTTKSADAGTPSIPTLEIEYSLDSTDGSDGTWSGLKEVPIGVQPLIDGASRGNGDDLFDPSTASKIPARWVRSKITLRDDEVVLP